MITEIKIYNDFSFPTSCNRIKVSDDKMHIIATGTYPPAYKVFHTENSSEILEKKMSAYIVDFCYVDGSPKKIAFMRDDKFIEFHFKYNLHYKLKMPDFGRYLGRFSTNLYFCTESVFYGGDLIKGRLNKISQTRSELNTFCTSKIHGLVALFSNNGVFFIDGRTNEIINVIRSDESYFHGDFDNNVMLYATSGNRIYSFDLRNMVPVLNVPIEKPKQVKCYKKHCYVAYSGGINIYNHIEKVDTLLADGITTFDLNDEILFVGFNEQNVKTFLTGVDVTPKWCTYTNNLQLG